MVVKNEGITYWFKTTSFFWACQVLAHYENLIQIVNPVIIKRSIYFRKVMSILDRIAVTLRFLATSDS